MLVFGGVVIYNQQFWWNILLMVDLTARVWGLHSPRLPNTIHVKVGDWTPKTYPKMLELLLMAEILHQLIGSLSHYL